MLLTCFYQLVSHAVVIDNEECLRLCLCNGIWSLLGMVALIHQSVLAYHTLNNANYTTMCVHERLLWYKLSMQTILMLK